MIASRKLVLPAPVGPVTITRSAGRLVCGSARSKARSGSPRTPLVVTRRIFIAAASALGVDADLGALDADPLGRQEDRGGADLDQDLGLALDGEALLRLEVRLPLHRLLGDVPLHRVGLIVPDLDGAVVDD